MSAALTFSFAIRAAFADGLPWSRFRDLVLPQVAAAAADPRVHGADRLLFAASGDSLFAATAAVPALRRWSGLRAQVFTSIEFARYELPLLARGDVAIGVSNSGSSSRTRETMTLARARAVPTFGITGSREGPLASLVDIVVHRPVARSPRVPERHRRLMLNMVEYVAALFTIYALGAAIGAARGALGGSAEQRLLADVAAAIEAIPAAAAGIEPAMADLARDLAGIDTLFCLGAGPSRGTADYAAAKFHEQMPLNGVGQDLEEWAHLQYFLTLSWRDRAVVLVHAPAGNSLDRAEELVEGIAGAGGRAIVVATPGHGHFAQAWRRIDLAPPIDELLSPLLFHLPAQLLVLHLAANAGVPTLPLARADDYRLIRKGLVRATAEGLA